MHVHQDHSRRLILTLGVAATLIALLTAHPEQETHPAPVAQATADAAAASH